MLKINAEDLARLCNNAMLFANPKSLHLPGEILFECNRKTLEVYACDDYFAITDRAPVQCDEMNRFVLNVKDIKGYTKDKKKIEGLEEFARRNKADEIQVSIKDSTVSFFATEEALTLEKGEYRQTNWETIQNLIHSPDALPVEVYEYYSNPERYSKLSQLKYDKSTYGIRWLNVETPQGHHLVRIEIGPTIKGVIRPLKSPEGEE